MTTVHGTPPPRHLVLVGMMATGKTTAGRLLAEALARPFFDSDQQIEARTGRTVREIWRSEGEEAFRALEVEALADALGSPAPSVIAAAGGVVLSPANVDRLAGDDVTVVWLRCGPPTLLERIRMAADTHRPLLDDDPEGTLERMHTDRSPRYEAVADHVVDVDGLAPDEVAAAVLAAVRP